MGIRFKHPSKQVLCSFLDDVQLRKRRHRARDFATLLLPEAGGWPWMATSWDHLSMKGISAGEPARSGELVFVTRLKYRVLKSEKCGLMIP